MSVLRLDHLAVVAETLDEGVDWVETSLGLPMAGGGEHAAMGTHNRLLSLGDVYLEVIAVNYKEPRRDFLRTLRGNPEVKLTYVHDKGTVSARYGVDRLPNMFIIGRDGRIAHTHIGYGEETFERLIEEILDYARYMEPKLTEEDVNDIVSSCLYFIEVKADSRGIKIEKELAPDLARVMLDRQQIKQVFLNLFLNALDAMGERGGMLRVRTRPLAKPGGRPWVQIETEDTGQGIAEANLEHIFDPFFTTKHESGEHEGTGLGLTIVHQIIEEHHGEIQVKSIAGSGTTFLVNLPAIPS